MGNHPEALLISTLFAEAGQSNCLVGRFDEARTRNSEIAALGEARWLLGVHRRAGTIHLSASVDDLSTFTTSTFIVTDHAVSQRELSELEGTIRALSKFLANGSSVTFTGLCRPTFTSTFFRQMVEKYSGLAVGSDIHLSYMPLFWSGETLQRFRERPKLVAGFGSEAAYLAQEIFLQVFPSMSTTVKLSAAEAAGLFGPIYKEVVRALEFELASLCEADDVDYSEALDLCKESGTSNLGIPRPLSARDAVASDIALTSSRRKTGMNLVRAARRVNEGGERRVLEMIKNALSLCGKRLRHSRIAILGFSGLDSLGESKPSPPTIIQTLARRGAVVSVYPGRDDRWFEAGVLGDGIRVENTPLRAASKANCALLALDSLDFGEISSQKLASEMSRPGAVCDLSRVLEASNVERAGLFYTSIGRGSTGA